MRRTYLVDVGVLNSEEVKADVVHITQNGDISFMKTQVVSSEDKNQPAQIKADPVKIYASGEWVSVTLQEGKDA